MHVREGSSSTQRVRALKQRGLNPTTHVKTKQNKTLEHEEGGENRGDTPF